MFDLSAALQGFLLGLGLFICPGPKDVLIFREALNGRPRMLLLAVGSGSDAVLIAAGVGGISAVLEAFPSLRIGVQVVGIVLLIAQARSAALAAMRGRAGTVASEATAAGGKWHRPLIATSLFNPAAWLDTVVVIGSVGAGMPGSLGASFSIGAFCASVAWFVVWVSFARGAAGWIAPTHGGRTVDAIVAVAMGGMALWLAFDLFGLL